MKITVNKKVLLHLYKNHPVKSQFCASFEMTQEGIGKSIGVMRSAVPRSVKALIRKGLLEEKLDHVKGLKRRRKTYVLTPSGFLYSRELYDSIGAMEVTLVRNGTEKKILLGEIGRNTENNIDVLVAISLLQNKTLNVDDYIGDSQETEKTGLAGDKKKVKAEPLKEEKDLEPIAFLKGSPDPINLLGRENETAALLEFLEDPQSSFCFISGLAGIGKSSLAAKVCRDISDFHNVLWFNVHTWDNLNTLILPLKKFLRKLHGDPNIDLDPSLGISSAVSKFEERRTKNKTVLFFDDIHLAHRDILDVLRAFLEMKNMGWLKFVLLGRDRVKFFDRRDVKINKKLVEMPLEGLDMESSSLLLWERFGRKLEDEKLERIWRLTGGHPLALKLVEPENLAQDQEDLSEFIEEEIFSRTSEQERQLIERMSVFRYPSPAESFFTHEKGSILEGMAAWINNRDLDWDGWNFSRITLLKLQRKGIVAAKDQGYELHDLIRDFFYTNMPMKLRKQHHIFASLHYFRNWEEGLEKTEGLEDIDGLNELADQAIEGIYQLQKAGKPMALLDMLGDNEHFLSYGSNVEELIEILQGLHEQILLKGERHHSKHHGILGNLFLSIGEQKNSINEFLKALVWEIKKATGITDGLEIYRGFETGDINVHVDDTMDYLSKWIRSRNYGDLVIDLKSLWKANVDLAIALTRSNYFSQAESSSGVALKIALLTGDERCIAQSYGLLGKCSQDMEDNHRAIRNYSRAISHFINDNDIPGAVRRELKDSWNYAKKGNMEKAISSLDRCSKYLEKP